MKSRIIGKAVSVVIVSMLLAWVMHHYQTSRGQMGREEYLAKQAERFDKHYARPDSFMLDLMGCMFLAVPLLGAYEGMAWVISKTLKGMDEESDS
jgi:hypothetical protein